MDVRQFDFLAAQPSAALKPRETFCGISKRALALLLVNVVFWQPIWAQADGIVVSSGGGNTRLDQAGNGVPIVTIATPGANGLSHNQFQDYNVDSRGVILNNVTDRTGNTQLGGIIVGNPNLKGAAAGVILNEVVGGSPSQLKGYTEVAGQSARVIVANPYGVTCNGCGFINTPRVTLTTGKPVLDGNRLDHFQVDGGSVSIEGNGLNADNVDQFDIVTRSAKINAELHARQLNVIAGRNDVAADSLATTPRAASPGDAPQLAIDSSALGGMYANTIRLVGTEAGVGVKLAGNLAASAGDIQLDANGQLTVAQAAASGNIALKGQGIDAQGPVYAGGSVNAQSSGDLSVRQSVAAANAIALNAAGQLTNGGIVEAGVNPDNSRNATGDVSLQGAGIANRGSVIASRSLTVTTAGTLDNTGATLSAGNQAQLNATVLNNTQGRVQSRGGLGVQAGTLTNAQGIVTSTGALEATLGQTTNGNGEISSQDRLTLRGQSLDNRQGKLIGTSGLDLTVTGNLDNRGGNLVSHGDLQARIAGDLDNRQQGNLYGAGATVLSFDRLLNAQGVLASDAVLTLMGNQVNNDGGKLGSLGNLTATLGSLDQLDGQLISQGQLTLIADRLGNTGNGLVAGKTGLELQVGMVDNRGGELSSQSGTANLTGQSLLNGGGKVIAGTVLTAKVATLDNSASGVLSAQQGLQVIGARLANDNGGLLTSGGDVQATLTGALANAGGQILGEGTMSLAATSLDNRQGIVSSAGQQTLTMTGGVVQNDGGQLVTDSGLSLGSASLDNGTGTLSAKGAVTLTTTGAISNAQNGRLISSDTLTVTANSLTNAGRLASTKDLAVTAATLTNSGELFSQAGVILDLQNGTLTNATSGLITAPGALLLKNLNTVRNAGELSSSLAFTLAAGSLDNSGGKLISNADLTLRIARALTNAKGTLSAAGLDLRAASLANIGGTLASRGDLSVTTTGLLDNSADGLLSAATTLDVTADTLSNAGGSLLAKGAATITAGQLDNTTKGLINSQASLIVTADHLDSSSEGEVSAKGDVQLTLGEFKQQGGRLIGEAAVGLDLGRAGGTGNLDNTGGLITTTGVLSFAHLNQVNNTGGEIGSSQGFSLIAQGLNNTRGKLISQGLLSIQASQLTNDGGLLSGWQGLTVTGGNLSNRQSGTLSSKVGDLTATLTGTLDNGDNGALVSQGVLKVTAASLTNTGGVLSSGAAQILTVTDTLQNGPQGLIDAGTTLSVSAGQFANTGGTAQAQGAFTASGGSLDNSNGTLNGQQTVTLDLVGALTNTSGAVLAKGDLLIKNATAVSNAHGRLNSGSLLTLLVGGLDNSSGGTVAGQTGLSVTTSGPVLNGGDGLLASQGGALNVTAGSLDNANGTLQSAGDLTLATGTGDIGNVGGKVIAQNGDLHITGANLDSRGGTLASLQGAFIAGINGLLKNGGQGQSGGTIQAQRLDLTAATLDNYNGKVSALGGNALLQTGRVDNRNGSLYGKGLVQVRGGSFDNSGDNDGKVFGSQIDFSLSGALNNRLGIIESSSTLSLAAASLDNTNGQLRALGTSGTTLLRLDGTLDNTNGRLETANQDLQLAIGGLTNTNGTLLHVGTGTFGLGLPLLQNAGGSVTSNGTLTLSGSSWTNSSTLQIANLAVNVDNLTQTGSGQLLAGNSFTGTGSNWTNDGVIAAGGNLGLTLGGTYQGAGRISSGYDFNLNAGQLLLDSPNARVAGGVGTTTFNIGGLLRNQARITSAGNANLSAGQVDNQGTLGAAGSLIVNTPTLTNLNGLIFSGGDMDLRVNDLTNRYADVYSLGRLLIARGADGSRANSFTNLSGSVESSGDLLVNATTILNARDVFAMSTILVDGDMQMTCGQHCAGKDWFKRGAVYVDRTIESRVEQDSPMSRLVTGGSAVLAGDSITNRYSTLSAAHDLAITGTTITNQAASSVSGSSRIQVGADVKIPTDTWDAREHDVAVYHTQYGSTFSVDAFQDLLSKFDPALFTGIDTPVQVASDGGYVAPAIIQAGGNVRLNASNDISNIVVERTPTASRASIADTSVTPTALTTTVTLNSQLPPDLAQQQVNPTTLSGFSLPTGQNGLFRLSGQQGSNGEASDQLAPVGVLKTQVAAEPTMRIQTALVGSGRSSSLPNGLADVSARGLTKDSGLASLPTSVGQSLPHRYLVETNPALTDLKQFLSSDYLLGNLNYNPDTSWKRLGDGLYEQRLIQQAIVQRTGQRFIDGLTSDDAQFKYLMDNAIASKQALGLSVGVSLTAAQVAALTHDIVWMEDQVINGEHVLVPVLYLANANNRLAPNGALIQGSDVTLIAGNDLTNSGTLKATNSLTATANNNLVNSGLIQSGDRLSLTSTLGDISNRAGGIISGRDVSLTASRGDILNERTVTTHAASYGGTSTRQDFADSAARIEASNNLSLTAGRDINNIGSVLSAGSNATLIAGRDVNLISAQTQTARSIGANNTSSSITQLGSSLTVGRDLGIGAGRDLTAVASTLSAGGNAILTAQDNLTLAAAADETHSYSKSKKVTRQEDHVDQQITTLTAGGNVSLVAKQGDLTMIASKVEAANEAYLYAGKDLNVLAAQDSDYSLYDMKKKGSFGAKKTQRDEVTDVRNIGSEIKAGGDITLQSEGSQTYQAAKLESGKDLTLDSGGDITFEAVKDLHQESHEKSSNSLAWTSMKGKGNTDETLKQSELVAQGQLAIQAANKIHIDVKDINAQSVSQTVDAMVKADPNLAWIKQAEAQGDIDWRQVKELHDSFKYSHSGLGQGAMLAVIIVMTVLTAGAASAAVGAAAGATAGSGTAMAAAGTVTTAATATTAATSTAVAAGWANAAATAALTSIASSGTVSLINNRGNIGATLKDTLSSDGMKNAMIAAGTAGVMNYASSNWFKTAVDPVSGKVTGAIPDVTNPGNFTRFAETQLLQGAVKGTLSEALGQGKFSDSLKGSVFSILQAAAFNQVGTLGKQWGLEDSGLGKTAMHAVVGGLLSEAMGGDFKSGAVAAGANEALIETLDKSPLLAGADQTQHQRLLNMASQLVGLVAAASVGGNAQLGAEIAGSAQAYNRQMHPDERKLIEKEAPALAAAKGISVEEATRQMTVAFAYYTDADWQKAIGANESVDPTALEYLAKALTPIANRYDVADSRGDVPLVGDKTYSSADTRRLLQNYQNTHGDFYDPTVNSEYLNKWTIGGADQRDFLQRNLNYGSSYDAFVNGGLGAAAGIGQGVGSTFGGLVNGAVGLATRPEQTINGVLGSIPTISEAFHNSTINSAQNFIYTLQGNSYESMRNQMQSSTELGLSLVGGEAGLAGRGASFSERVAWKQPVYSISDEMRANPYHVDWQSYAGGDARAAGADATRIESGLSGAEITVTSTTAVQELEVDAYKNLKAKEVVGDGLEHDHIPSFAALRTAKEAELGRPLTELETKALYQNSTAVEVPRDVHIAGPTYGGKNTPAQIQQDAMDLCGAVCRDTDALRENLTRRGYDSALIDQTVQKILERNRATGVIDR